MTAIAITGALFGCGFAAIAEDRPGLALLFVALGAFNAWAC